jgi:hypothetical protein
MRNLSVLPTLGLTLIAGPRGLRRELTTRLSVHLALLGGLRVLDGGNSFDGLKLARELRRQTRAYHPALERVQVRRAFTCYQMGALLGDTRPDQVPTLVLDLLATFYDENVALSDRRRLLESVLDRLAGLSRAAPVFVSAEPGADPFFGALESRADQQWRFEMPPAAAIQPALF